MVLPTRGVEGLGWHCSAELHVQLLIFIACNHNPDQEALANLAHGLGGRWLQIEKHLDHDALGNRVLVPELGARVAPMLKRRLRPERATLVLPVEFRPDRRGVSQYCPLATVAHCGVERDRDVIDDD